MEKKGTAPSGVRATKRITPRKSSFSSLGPKFVKLGQIPLSCDTQIHLDVVYHVSRIHVSHWRTLLLMVFYGCRGIGELRGAHRLLAAMVCSGADGFIVHPVTALSTSFRTLASEIVGNPCGVGALIHRSLQKTAVKLSKRHFSLLLIIPRSRGFPTFSKTNMTFGIEFLMDTLVVYEQ